MHIVRVVPVLLVVGVVPVAAQVNIERMRLREVQAGFGAALGTTFSWRTGNVQLVKFDVSGRVDYRLATSQVFAVGSGDFGWVDGERFSNEALLHFRQVFQTDQPVQIEMFQQFNYDKSRQLDGRWVLGGGPRIRFWATEQVDVWLGGAYMLEHEQISAGADREAAEEVTSHRWSAYLSGRFVLSEGSAVQVTGYVQPTINRVTDVRAIGDAQLGARIVGGLSMSVSVLFRYDSDPPTDVATLDTSVRTGFNYEF